ncbi:non-ribosomal peptide synthetase [Dactylosporangium sp. NPDC005555]|uniref:non-ribosomal peptide synthetase n=1 Tax=Dactylosporangium sp. NPDC005555 TaxID=3154889 RepID=UPI0033BF4309
MITHQDTPVVRDSDAATTTLVSRIEEFARTAPLSPAVRHGDRALTYGELDQQANQLAHELSVLGVRRGDMVAMYLGRSIEWVVGMLGCLKAGGVCMPLDPSVPAERFHRAVTAGRPTAVVAAAHCPNAAEVPPVPVGVPVAPCPGGGNPTPPVPSGLPVVTIDAGVPARDQLPDPGPAARREELAYAMFTSGSTGAAKIVLAQHSWLALSAARSATINGTTAADRGSWLGAAGAGIAIHEVGGLLWQGAEIVIGEHDVIASPPALRDWLLAEQITLSFVITPVGEVLQNLPWPRETALRLLTLGGDRLNQWGPAGLPFEIAVSYGSLEAFQVANSSYPWDRRCTPATATDADRQAAPPVGRPIEGVTVHLLEDDGRTPVGDGIGEVWIDSDCLSLGYLGDPAQTADRFRPNPFGAPGSRLYRSGDAGRFRPDGVLEHHGRIDDIVKIRGHRVELGDVEWVLGRHPAVRQVAVVPTMDGDQRRLVACFTAETGVSPLELREHALERLPDFMIPVAFVQLDELPLNTSNKIDRRRLPPADWARGRPVRAWRAPAPGAETELARLFADLLHVDRVGADDHFLELGGDSLLLARLQGHIEQDLGTRVEMNDLVTDPTVSGLAQLVSAAGPTTVAPAIPQITPRRR